MTEQPTTRLPWPEELRLIGAIEEATRYYRDTLLSRHGTGPRRYLTSRGVDHVLDRDSAWQVGYAPTGWTHLAQQLRTTGYDDDESMAAGLVTRCRRGTVIDRFRDRIVVPIRDHLHGHVIAFTARAAPGAAPEVPKYLNTPTTALYRKSDELLGLHEQREPLQEGATPALVEGAFDVLAMAAPATGRRLVPVSPCGTHVNPLQLAELVATATCRSLVIAFDNDPAGRLAANRISELAATTGIPVSTMALAEGLDPASARAPRPSTPLGVHAAPATFYRSTQRLP